MLFRSGPELLAGSTRLKMGTATKLVLNMLTVGTMVQLGKVYGPWMVDVRPTSAKLRHRALRIIQAVARVTPARARTALRAADDDVKLAIVLAARGPTTAHARALLNRARGRLRMILEA